MVIPDIQEFGVGSDIMANNMADESEGSNVSEQVKRNKVTTKNVNGITKACSIKSVNKTKQSDSRIAGKSEGSFGNLGSGGRLYAVTFMMNGDEVYARKFNTKASAIQFATTDPNIIKWRSAHPENNDIIGKIIEVI